MSATTKHERGLQLIIVYKLVKGTASVALAIILLALSTQDGGEALQDAALFVQSHVMGAWSLHVAHFLMRATTPHYVHLAIIALSFDGVLTLVEGWSLKRGYTWGPWLVVLATTSLLPLEIVALVKHRRIGRALILIVNVAIVVYLVRHALWHTKRARAASGRTGA